MICSSVNRPFFISESPFVASSYRADLKILNFSWSKLPRAGQGHSRLKDKRSDGVTSKSGFFQTLSRLFRAVVFYS